MEDEGWRRAATFQPSFSDLPQPTPAQALTLLMAPVWPPHERSEVEGFVFAVVGLIPSTGCLAGLRIGSEERLVHTMGLLHPAQLGAPFCAALSRAWAAKPVAAVLRARGTLQGRRGGRARHRRLPRPRPRGQGGARPARLRAARVRAAGGERHAVPLLLRLRGGGLLRRAAPAAALEGPGRAPRQVQRAQAGGRQAARDELTGCDRVVSR